MRRAFSLVELLVVIAIISVLMAMLLPAVQKVRDSANRTVCVNNFHQFVLAAHAYHDVHQAFPYNDYDTNLTGWSWIMRILPQVEQSSLYNQCRAAGAPTETLAGSTVLTSVLCPSESGPKMDVGPGGRNYARTNIAGCDGGNDTTGSCFPLTGGGPLEPASLMETGPESASLPSPIPSNHGNGILPIRVNAGGVSMSMVTDGLSNTLLAAEIRSFPHTMPRWCFASQGAVASGYLPIGTDPRGFSSNHPGVLPAAMACGRVAMIRMNVDMDLFRNACSMNGGESATAID